MNGCAVLLRLRVLLPAMRGVLSKRMGGLSNFFKSPDPGSATVRGVAAGEIESALRLLLGANARPAESAIAAQFEEIARLRNIDLTALQVAAADGTVIAAALPIPSAGGTALMMLSTAGTSRPLAKCIARCAAASVAALSDGPPLLVQALLETVEAAAVAALTGAGFDRLATLLYLQRSCNRSMPMPKMPDGLNLHTYCSATHDLFCRGIEASYIASLDCPPLHGTRTTEDVIASHKATGEFDPNLWFCLTENHQPIGLLLLARVSGHASMELVYLGLAPSARGRQIGDYLVKRALAETHLGGLEQLTLAVDSQNDPALRLYFRHGLAEVHRRVALIQRIPSKRRI